jgi:hypothetical protein
MTKEPGDRFPGKDENGSPGGARRAVSHKHKEMNITNHPVHSL